MITSEEIKSNLNAIDSAFNTVYSERSKHLRNIMVILFFSIFAMVIGLIIQIAEKIFNDAWQYSEFVLSTCLPNIFIIASVIVGLVLYGNKASRFPSRLASVFSSQLQLLTAELIEQAKSIFKEEIKTFDEAIRKISLAGFDALDIQPQAVMRNAGLKIGDPSEDRLHIVGLQVKTLASELDVLSKSVSKPGEHVNLIFGAYGFAILTAVSCSAVFIGGTLKADIPRVLLLSVSAICSLACYIIFTRPINLQMLAEDALSKLGISLDALEESLQARSYVMPKEELDKRLFDESAEYGVKP